MKITRRDITSNGTLRAVLQPFDIEAKNSGTVGIKSDYLGLDLTSDQPVLYIHREHRDDREGELLVLKISRESEQKSLFHAEDIMRLCNQASVEGSRNVCRLMDILISGRVDESFTNEPTDRHLKYTHQWSNGKTNWIDIGQPFSYSNTRREYPLSVSITDQDGKSKTLASNPLGKQDRPLEIRVLHKDNLTRDQKTPSDYFRSRAKEFCTFASS